MAAPIIFNRQLKKTHRDRSANLLTNNDFLIEEGAARIAETFDEEIVEKFPFVLDLGCRLGNLSQNLTNRAGIKNIVQCDMSERCISKARPPFDDLKVVADEEFLPFAENSFNAVLSSLSLHWVNDLPGTLIQINRILKDRGLLMASFLGGSTLNELRESILQTEIEVSGGTSPAISPFIEIKDAGALLQRTGYKLPVSHSDIVTVNYDNIYSIIKDLRAMGETNSLAKMRKSFRTKETLDLINKKYKQLYSNENGEIEATFEIITIVGWKS